MLNSLAADYSRLAIGFQVSPKAALSGQQDQIVAMPPAGGKDMK